jgi:hypothetical protein
MPPAATDQRGQPRSHPTCDIGAYEVQTVLLAVPGGQTSGLCQSWADACELRYALSGSLSGQEIWAAAGTYKPAADTNRAATFQLKDGVALYGGFAGTESARAQRNPAVNVTVLSGDLNGDDNNNVKYDEPTRADNSYHVVTGVTGATLDGFIITAGHADGTLTGRHGGGMYNDASSPALTNVTFISNVAILDGGGMYNDASSPALTNVTFSGNVAIGYGGGMYNDDSSPTLARVTFNGNISQYMNGGGMYNWSSSPSLTNVTFSGNSAWGNGAGMYNGSSSPLLTNVTFSGNAATFSGGGMFSGGAANPQVHNTIFWGNTASNGAQIFADSVTPTLSDCVVEGGYAGTNVITTTPNLGTLGNYGGATQTIPLLAGSSAIDTGNNATCASTDQRGVARPQGARCGIGAYELDTTAPMVTSVTRLNPSPTNLASVDFAVTFSEAVTGVGAAGFAVTSTGTIGGAAVTGVAGGPIAYTVTVNTGTGNGAIRLDVTATAAISDIAGNSLAGLPYIGGDSYSVDKIAPTVAMTSLAANPANSSPIAVTVDFSEIVTGFSSAGVATVNGAVSNFTGSGASYAFDLIPAGQGLVTAGIAAGVATDLAGNGNTVAAQFARAYDSIAPTVVSSLRAGANPTSAAMVSFTVTFSESVTGVDVSDFALTKTGAIAGESVTGVSGGPAVYTVTVNTGTGSGAIRLDVVDDHTIVDAALNPLGGSYTGGETYDVRLYRTYLPLVVRN